MSAASLRLAINAVELSWFPGRGLALRAEAAKINSGKMSELPFAGRLQARQAMEKPDDDNHYRL